jgi:hypothetical protein
MIALLVRVGPAERMHSSVEAGQDRLDLSWSWMLNLSSLST